MTDRHGRRRTMLAVPLFLTSCLAVGVGAAAVISWASDNSGVPAADPPAAVVPSSAPDLAVDQAAAVAIAPLAATVPKPVDESTAPTAAPAVPVVEAASAACVVAVRGADVACSLTGDHLEFTLCVPDATTVIRVGTRHDDSVKFKDASSSVVLGGTSSCASGEIAAAVGINAYSPAVTWRVVGRNADDEKIWKSRVESAPAP